MPFQTFSLEQDSSILSFSLQVFFIYLFNQYKVFSLKSLKVKSSKEMDEKLEQEVRIPNIFAIHSFGQIFEHFARIVNPCFHRCYMTLFRKEGSKKDCSKS
jgi:hypothetical protein